MRDARLEGTAAGAFGPLGNLDSPVKLATFFEALSMPNDCANADADEVPTVRGVENAGWKGIEVTTVGLVDVGGLLGNSVHGFDGVLRGLSDPITLRCFSEYGGTFPAVPLDIPDPKGVSLLAVESVGMGGDCFAVEEVTTVPLFMLCPSVFEGDPMISVIKVCETHL
ncbi:unnamed protein product [Echinostoma caproni]|uniref:Amidase domain-containing protein n=1 Tax=Echinostoma caproni TaxID=27848 RepID=A0A183AFQ6_9TREM|nr:unnamed protein product [Echinostoma caproni]